ncbi:MAG: hypothetical protein WCL16_06210 [bacterium]
MSTAQNEATVTKLLLAMNYTAVRIDAAITALQGEAAAVRVVDEPLLTPAQLCRRLGISSTSLWRMQPPFIRVGARKRFVWSEIESFLKKGQVAA